MPPRAAPGARRRRSSSSPRREPSRLRARMTSTFVAYGRRPRARSPGSRRSARRARRTRARGGAAAAAGPLRAARPRRRQFPEGVAYDERSNRYFVSSQSNGAILTGELKDPAARVLSPPGADGRTNANGLDTDRKGRLWVATGQQARVYVLDSGDGSLIRWLSLRTGSYANDVGITRRHGVFITDSLQPILWRIDSREASAGAPGAAEPWLDLTTTPVVYGTGFNFNGIEATRNGRYLLAVQSNTGQLWRISTRTKRGARGRPRRRAPAGRRRARAPRPPPVGGAELARPDHRGPARSPVPQRRGGRHDDRPELPVPDHGRHRARPHARGQQPVRPPHRRPCRPVLPFTLSSIPVP